jgi:hypothetical protein
MNWRERINKNLRAYVEEIISQSFYHKESYNFANDRGKAQIWVALGILSKQIHELDSKLNYIERALQEIGLKDKNRDIEKIKQDKKEVEDIFRSILSGKKIVKKEEKYDSSSKLIMPQFQQIPKNIQKKIISNKKTKIKSKKLISLNKRNKK